MQQYQHQQQHNNISKTAAANSLSLSSKQQM
jgi:hypothetical protein